MNILFLDINGVMVTPRHRRQSKAYRGPEFDPRCVASLRNILRSTDAKIVVTSTWRVGHTFSDMVSIFAANGLTNCLVGQTPVLRNRTRADEIGQYIAEVQGTPYEVTRFVIVDDMSDMGNLQPHFVQTKYRFGLNDRVGREVIARLRG